MTELAAWMEARGITGETLRSWGCTETDDNDLVFHYRGYTKTRHFNDKRTYTQEPKGIVNLFMHPTDEGAGVTYICEGESDAMRLWQEIQKEYPGSGVQVVGLPGLSSWRPEMAKDLKSVNDIYVVFDNDSNYQAIAQAESAWQAIRRDVPKAKRVHLPGAVKDICEFFNTFNLDFFLEQLKIPNYHYKALDFKKSYPPTEWLVDKTLAQGDVVLWSGDPGAQKSWMAMALAVAVAENHDTWLNFPVLGNGNVLYVDEENPEDVVRERMTRLGLVHPDRVRYLLRQGVDLNKNPNLLLDEVLDFKPKLIVLDSFVAISGGSDENASGAVRPLFQNGIFPLARETGATVVVLHHNNKTASESPFAKVRGSGDISGAPDSCFTVGRVEGGHVRVVQFKTRRGRLTEPFNCFVKDNQDGSATMQRVQERF